MFPMFLYKLPQWFLTFTTCSQAVPWVKLKMFFQRIYLYSRLLMRIICYVDADNCYGFIKCPWLSICIFSFSLSFSFCHCYADLPLRFFVVTLDFKLFPRVFSAEIGKGKNPTERGCVDFKRQRFQHWGFDWAFRTIPTYNCMHTVPTLYDQKNRLRGKSHFHSLSQWWLARFVHLKEPLSSSTGFPKP